MAESRYERRGCGCIDVHTHVVPRLFPRYMGRDPAARWPSTQDAKPCHRHVMLDGRVYRTVSQQSWESSVRVEDMNRTGVGHQVLSPMPELLSYWMSAEDGAAMCRFLNETIADMVATAPDRFSGLGAVPLQDLDRAIEEVAHARGSLGLAGVEIGTHVNGRPIGDPTFRPFFSACRDLGASVFVHPLRPTGTDRLVGPAMLEQLLAFPGEIGLAAMSMVTGGTMRDLPGLRVAFSHGGGSLPILVARIQHGWRVQPALREALGGEQPLETVRRMYYDDLLYDSRAILSLVALVGETQVMVGTDYPFVIMDDDPRGRLDSLDLPEAAQRSLCRENARRWLGIPGEHS